MSRERFNGVILQIYSEKRSQTGLKPTQKLLFPILEPPFIHFLLSLMHTMKLLLLIYPEPVLGALEPSWATSGKNSVRLKNSRGNPQGKCGFVFPRNTPTTSMAAALKISEDCSLDAPLEEGQPAGGRARKREEENEK